MGSFILEDNSTQMCQSFEALNYLLIAEAIRLPHGQSHMRETDQTVDPEKDEDWKGVRVVGPTHQGRHQQADRQTDPVKDVRRQCLTGRNYLRRVRPDWTQQPSPINRHENAQYQDEC